MLFFRLCHMIFPYEDTLFFQTLSRDTSIYRSSSFFVCLHKEATTCFSDTFFQKTIQHSNGSCNATGGTQFICKQFKKNLFLSANKFETQIVCKDYCNVRHEEIIFFQPSCRYHIIIKEDLKEVAKNWTHSASTTSMWIVNMNFSVINAAAKCCRGAKSMLMCRGLFNPSNKTEGWTEPSTSQ